MNINAAVCLLSSAFVGLSVSAVEAVRISSFGYDPVDSTRFVQAAFDSGHRKLILDRQAGPWYVLPLKMRSNTELVLEPGVELVAKRGAYKGIRDYLLELPHVTNVVIRGGAGSTLRMWKTDYQGSDYKHGEWRYALRLFHVQNVLVEGLRICDSGGDGIGVTGRDIVIRNCVCDNNHRQGISVFNVDGLLIEDTVLSNTKGTPPEAGIDFEPDHAKEGLVRVVMRNCLSVNNNGRGYEFYLGCMNTNSPRMSVLLENCRSVGNSESLMVYASRRDDNHVTGEITVRNCTFADARRNAVRLKGLPDAAPDVTLENCVISNAAGRTDLADIVLSSDTLRQGPPDGLRFENLRIVQSVARPWLAYAPQGAGPFPRRIGGDVTVVAPNEPERRVRLDAAWVRENLRPLNGGRPLPPRRALPKAEEVVAVDAKPGRLVPLAPCTMIGGAKLVFLVSETGTVTFVARQVIAVAGRKPDVKRIAISPLDGQTGCSWTLPCPDEKPQTVSIDVPKTGFYALTVPSGGTRFLLEQASVPVAIDVSTSERIVAAQGGRPFSLFVRSAGSDPFTLLASGSDYYRFGVTLCDPSGRVVTSREMVDDIHTREVPSGESAGLWRLDFKASAKPHYDWITLDVYGISGCLFLSSEKTWKP